MNSGKWDEAANTLFKLAYVAGVSPLEAEDWTWGELLAMAAAGQDRRRNALQDLARVAYSQAIFSSQVLVGKARNTEIWDAFPGVWSDDEVREMKLAKYKQIMQRHAAQGGGRT